MWTRHIRPAPPPVAPRPRNRTTLLIAGLTTLLAVSGCTSSSPEAPPAPEDRQGASEVSDQTPAPSQDPSPEQEPPLTSDGRPQVAYLTIPELDIRNLRVEPYQGQTDDAPGTEIQDRGIAASPHGPSGGVGPGGIGNYQVTAHRNSAGGPFLAIPDLRNGARIEVATDQRTYVYQVIETRETSFRSERSLAEQRAAVPGHPGRTPSQAMITLSTCATQEDHAAGNYWADDQGNPEHRIDKIGILISSHPA
ncbi:sortase [Streptomyces sp. 8K308]|uniref:sortase domain-containing protein n=1 Tax=Streptomyces sp. 8K308 TaxID=2530388 RepID=UPI0010436E99|nr:sortase [Streptomyces sp. 8K308]TDC25833.1 sortase [Streptomyces sp. 8K308]